MEPEQPPTIRPEDSAPPEGATSAGRAAYAGAEAPRDRSPHTFLSTDAKAFDAARAATLRLQQDLCKIAERNGLGPLAKHNLEAFAAALQPHIADLCDLVSLSIRFNR